MALSRRTLVACAVAACLLEVIAPRVSLAGDDAVEARAAYAKGTKAFSQKRYGEAALLFEAASAAKKSAIALYTAGLAWDRASQAERAADAYARALDAGGGLDDQQMASAKERLAALEAQLGTLVISSLPEGSRVQLEAFSEVPAPARLHGAPGAHALTIQVPNRVVEHRDVTLEAGKATAFEWKDPLAEPAKAPEASGGGAAAELRAELAGPPPSESSFWTPAHVAGVGVGAAGVGLLVSSAMLWSNASSAKQSYEGTPTRASFDHASGLETSTNVVLVSGAILAAAGVALMLWPTGDKPAASHVGFGPRSVSLEGRF